MFRRFKINFVINILMFLCMAVITGIGLLMEYILIPGKETFTIYGRNVDLFYMGMDRHEWGAIHLVFAFILLGLLILHIILHWKMIRAMYRRFIGIQKIRFLVATVFLSFCGIFIIYPFITNPEIHEFERGRRADNRPMRNNNIKETVKHSNKILHKTNISKDTFVEVQGYMTLNEVAKKHNTSIKYLKEKLNIPQHVSGKERLGRLRKRYGFRMGDVEKILAGL